MNSTFGAIFDLDGTLADTAPAIVKSYRRTLLELNISYDGELDILWGARMESVISHISSCVGSSIDMKDFLSISGPVQLEVFGTPREEYVTHVAAIDALVKDGINVAVATSSTKDRAYSLLAACGYTFEHVITGDCVTKGKPHPECFLKAANLIGVDPKHCVVVEDAPIGIEAAYAAGMKSIGIRTKEQDLTAINPPPHILLDDITQITPKVVYSLLK